MTDKCCVPGCKENYATTSDNDMDKVSIFRFPKDPEMHAKWIWVIPRQVLVVRGKMVVCKKHFSEQFIIRVDIVTRDDGSVLSVPRQRPKLTADAYPSLFPNTPSYLSSEPARKRRTPEDRLLDQSVCDDQQFQQWLADDNICSFDMLDEKLANFVADSGSPWSIIRSDGCICLCTFDMSDVPKIVCAIKVLRDLSVQVYRGQYTVNFDSLK